MLTYLLYISYPILNGNTILKNRILHTVGVPTFNIKRKHLPKRINKDFKLYCLHLINCVLNTMFYQMLQCV